VGDMPISGDWYISHQLFLKIYVGKRLVYLPPVIPKKYMLARDWYISHRLFPKIYVGYIPISNQNIYFGISGGRYTNL
jgi:hypothetical protein